MEVDFSFRSDAEKVKYLQDVKTLNLSYTNINFMIVTKFKSLRELHLVGCNLQDKTIFFKDLNLSILNLTSNNLTDIPEVNKNLKLLILHQNNISSFQKPSEFDDLDILMYNCPFIDIKSLYNVKARITLAVSREIFVKQCLFYNNLNLLLYGQIYKEVKDEDLKTVYDGYLECDKIKNKDKFLCSQQLSDTSGLSRHPLS